MPVPRLNHALSPLLAQAGIPAHITVLYPFVAPPISDDEIERVGEVIASVEPFGFNLVDVGWFTDQTVYLRPDPADAFESLTSRLVARWPDYLPYGGVHEDTVPHLTLADREPPSTMRALAERISPQLPISCRATEVWLMQGSHMPASWERLHRFPLSGVS